MRRRASIAICGALVALALLPVAARAEFGVDPDSLSLQILDAAGATESRAGAHPDRVRIDFSMNALAGGAADGNLKDAVVELPLGLVGDPSAIPTCPRELLTAANLESCPPASQIGNMTVRIGSLGIGAMLYNLEPRPGNLAEFGFEALLFDSHMVLRIGPDGRLVARISNAVQDMPLMGMSIELWGVPADHQAEPAPRRALLTTPTRCDVPTTVTVRARSWEEQAWLTTTARAAPFTDCAGLAFQPGLELGLGSAASDTPTAVRLDLVLPREADDPDGRAADRIESVAIDLPEGMALSPGAANGLTACPEQAVGLGAEGPANCPPTSRAGTVALTTPLIAEPLTGRIYMGEQLAGTDYRLYVVASGSGVDLKLPLLLHADPVTGRLRARVSGLPPLPLERLSLSFAGGARAPLTTPLGCGAAVASATFVPYGGGAPVASSASAAISSAPSGAPCPALLPFAPSFVAGADRARARVATPFGVTIRRRDGERPLSRFRIRLPPGVNARLASVTPCGGAELAVARCPSASRIGTATTEVGPGASPLPLAGDVFLTGPYRATRPYRRTPFGLAIVFNGSVGPFDLGKVSVRAALDLDPRSGQVRIDSDPMPSVVRGIPLRMQTLAIDIDRPGFVANPTSCAPTRSTALLQSTDGAVARPWSRFAVRGCAALPFRPRVSMALLDRSELRAGGHPRLRLRVRPDQRGANIRKTSVAMPKLLAASPIGPAAICSLEQAGDGRCPAQSKIGTASGRAPVLGAPLRGAAYLVQPPRGGLPDVWALMRGAGATLRLRMRIVRDGDGRLHGQLVDLPDLSLAALTITFAGGERGMFTATRGACADGRARAIFAAVRLTGHNAARRSLRPRVAVPDC